MGRVGRMAAMHHKYEGTGQGFTPLGEVRGIWRALKCVCVCVYVCLDSDGPGAVLTDWSRRYAQGAAAARRSAAWMGNMPCLPCVAWHYGIAGLVSMRLGLLRPAAEQTPGRAAMQKRASRARRPSHPLVRLITQLMQESVTRARVKRGRRDGAMSSWVGGT